MDNASENGVHLKQGHLEILRGEGSLKQGAQRCQSCLELVSVAAKL